MVSSQNTAINFMCLNTGRVNLVELQEVLNVDLSHIESKVHEIVRSESSLNLVLGQIVSE